MMLSMVRENLSAGWAWRIRKAKVKGTRSFRIPGNHSVAAARASKMAAQVGETIDRQKTARARADLLFLQDPGVRMRHEHRAEPGLERRVDVRFRAVADQPGTLG